LSNHSLSIEPQQAEKRHGTKLTSHTVNHVSSVFAELPLSHPTPTPEPINHSSMPAYAFWTANAVVDPSTGTAMEYPQLKLGEDSKLWLAAASREIGRLAQGKQPDMPLAATQCTSWIAAAFLQVAKTRITHRCSRQDAQGRNAPHPLHRWRQPHRLQRQSQHSYRQLRDHQDSPQQHRVHPECKNAHCQH
jgi:hypothetical protein